MMAAIGAISEQVTELTGRVDDIGVKADWNGEKTDRIIAALEKAGIVFPPDAPAPTTAPAAAPAPTGGGAKPPVRNAWMTATSGGGRGGGKKRPGRGMGGTVSEDYAGWTTTTMTNTRCHFPLQHAPAAASPGVSTPPDFLSAGQARPATPAWSIPTHVSRQSILGSGGLSTSIISTISVMAVMRA